MIIFYRDHLPLLGTKDQEKILEKVAKVDKHSRGWQERSFTRPLRCVVASAPYRSIHCYYCRKFGHARENCFKRKRDLAKSFPRNAIDKEGNYK